MSVLTIRANKRYALRLPIEVKRKGRRDATGLLIEVSQQGARISNLGRGTYEQGEVVTIVTPHGVEWAAAIRWAHDGLAGVKLERSLHLPEMQELLDVNRRQQIPSGWRFGT